MSEYKAHLFICTNTSDKEVKCGNRGSEDLRIKVKKLCAKEFGDSVRVNKAGCLGHCEKGITAVIYPQDKWMFEVKSTDEAMLVDAVRNALLGKGT